MSVNGHVKISLLNFECLERDVIERKITASTFMLVMTSLNFILRDAS